MNSDREVVQSVSKALSSCIQVYQWRGMDVGADEWAQHELDELREMERAKLIFDQCAYVRDTFSDAEVRDQWREVRRNLYKAVNYIRSIPFFALAAEIEAVIRQIDSRIPPPPQHQLIDEEAY